MVYLQFPGIPAKDLTEYPVGLKEKASHYTAVSGIKMRDILTSSGYICHNIALVCPSALKSQKPSISHFVAFREEKSAKMFKN